MLHYLCAENNLWDIMEREQLNTFIPARPAKPSRTILMGMHIQPGLSPGHVRSTPRGIAPSSGQLSQKAPTERPIGVSVSGVSLEAAAEPENVPTLEPTSPF